MKTVNYTCLISSLVFTNQWGTRRGTKSNHIYTTLIQQSNSYTKLRNVTKNFTQDVLHVGQFSPKISYKEKSH